MSSAGRYRLGSSADCKANSRRHSSSPGAGSTSRKLTRIGPLASLAARIQPSSARVSSATSAGFAPGRAGSAAVRATIQRSGSGAFGPGRCPSSNRSGITARAAASTRPSSASCKVTRTSAPVARQTGGMAAAKSRYAAASAPVSTGRQRAAGSPASVTELRQHPAAPGQVAGVPGQDAEVPQGGAGRPRPVRIGIGQRTQGTQRRGGRNQQRRRLPRGQPDRTAGALDPGLGRRQRPSGGAGQLQGQRGVDGLGQCVPDVVGGFAQRGGQRLRRHRERVGPRPRGQGAAQAPRPTA